MSRKDLEGRVVIVTGAAGGIGRALVRTFLDNGMRVVAADLDGEPLRRLHGEIDSDRLAAVPVDISDYGSCQNCVERAEARFGRVDCLVNNAGLGMGLVREDHFSRRVQIEDIRPEVWQKIVTVNLTGGFFMAHVCVPRFRAQGFGRIVNVTTSFFTMLNPGFSPYGPAKSGLEAWSASLAGELKGTGITVNVVVPGGPTDTPMVPDNSGIARDQMIKPEQMAYPMLYLFSDDASEVTGRRYVAAHWEPALPDVQAEAASGAPAGWPDLARNPVWPGRRPGQ
ncbi:MAG: SDR family oxidoreductase [Alphaproteobacteria bacterium]|nr:SDR family oxidoreductase [Alphaproteobacteria bacterium]